jgi:hypothetical protein
MPGFALVVRGLTQNVREVAFPEGYSWQVRLRCSSCGQATDWVYFTRLDQVELKGDRSSCNFLMACKNCERRFNASVLEESTLQVPEGQQRLEGRLASF